MFFPPSVKYLSAAYTYTKPAGYTKGPIDRTKLQSPHISLLGHEAHRCLLLTLYSLVRRPRRLRPPAYTRSANSRASGTSSSHLNLKRMQIHPVNFSVRNFRYDQRSERHVGEPEEATKNEEGDCSRPSIYWSQKKGCKSPKTIHRLGLVALVR